MTVPDLVAKLEAIAEDYTGDQESDHLRADKLLLKFIDDPRVTLAFNAIDKWYA